jgi:hypothetical protein
VLTAFYRGRGSTRETWPGVVTSSVNGFTAIEGRVSLSEVKEGP